LLSLKNKLQYGSDRSRTVILKINYKGTQSLPAQNKTAL